MGRSRALVTIVRNENVFFPLWLRYYGQFFAPEDIYVFDHGSSDGSTDVGGFNKEVVSHETVDHNWMRKTIQAKQNELIERYDVVLINDVDEIIAPNPEKYGTLGDFIDAFDEEFVNCHGYELLHHRDTEPPIDLEASIMAQRGWWFPNFAYSKPILATVPMKWYDGFHARQDGRANFDYDLRLIHLHRFDYDLCRERHRFRSSVPWSGRDLESNSGYQNRITDDEKFEYWFYNDSCTMNPIEEERVPDIWRTVF
ncbi:MAG: glycosyltransferase family 2 protein [Acidimicrobiales bacterium]|nr:glycosyltransferase family 2 protein [Acidimicrobiales bacterium]